jgi:hypothetical protein
VIISAVWIGIAMFVDVLCVDGDFVDVKIEYKCIQESNSSRGYRAMQS